MTGKWKKLWAAKPKNDDRICISDYKMAYDEEHDTWYPNIGRISNIFGLTFEDGLLVIDADYVLLKERRTLIAQGSICQGEDNHAIKFEVK